MRFIRRRILPFENVPVGELPSAPVVGSRLGGGAKLQLYGATRYKAMSNNDHHTAFFASNLLTATQRSRSDQSRSFTD